jgi:hypothetical protein
MYAILKQTLEEMGAITLFIMCNIEKLPTNSKCIK